MVFSFDAILALPGLLKKLLFISCSDPKHLLVSTNSETSRHKSERFLLCSIAYHNLTLEQQETFWTDRPGKSYFYDGFRTRYSYRMVLDFPMVCETQILPKSFRIVKVLNSIRSYQTAHLGKICTVDIN
jgi:hypothetical protein